MAAGKPLRIAVIDDSVVVRRVVADGLRGDPRIVEVRTAGDGRAGVALVKEMRPDLVTMDIEMPVMNGIEATREIRTFDRRVPIVMFSTLTAAGARATFDAFTAGATDFVTKPGQARSMAAGMDSVRVELLPKILALADPRATARAAVAEITARSAQVARAATSSALPGQHPRTGPLAPHRPGAQAGRPGSEAQPRIVAIGSSTGGPEALSLLLRRLPGDLGVPIVIVQHMPAMFTRLLAERLDVGCKLRVTEAVDNAPLLPDTVTIAPGGRHMVVVRDGPQLRARLTDGPLVNSCRPSVDVLFSSLNPAVGAAVLAIVLTGMGADGALGAAGIAAAGGRVFAQDEASAVVWGMPGATVATGVVEKVLTVEGLSDALVVACRSTRGAIARTVPAAAGVRVAPGTTR